MDLFLAAVQVVPILFIPLLLDRRIADDSRDRSFGRLRLFRLLVAALGWWPSRSPSTSSAPIRSLPAGCAAL